MDYDTRHWQYRQLATIFHGPKFGHYMELEIQLKGRDSTKRVGLGQWTGVGIPEQVLRSASSLMVATFEEHCLMRYSIREELPRLWDGDPDPF